MSAAVTIANEPIELVNVDDVMQNSTQGEGEGELAVVAQVKNDEDVLIGYQCREAYNDNYHQLIDVDVTMFLDMAFPPGTQDLALSHVQQGLVDVVNSRYHIKSGERCDNPVLDGTSWLVQFLVDPKNIERQTEVFANCKELSYDPETEDCGVFMMTVTGSKLTGSRALPDVESFLESEINGKALTKNSPYRTQFLSVLQTEEGSVSDSGRDNLNTASNVKTETAPQVIDDGSNKVTILGGFLVAALCCALVGTGFILWRRRREYLKEQNPTLSLSKSDLEQYDTADLAGIGDHDEDDAGGGGERAVEAGAGTEEEAFPSNITFDLGTSFKDQLMGVHGAGQQRADVPSHVRPQTTKGGLGNFYPQSIASDSDVDSWAQTDGTIGSLELQLEPITAEV